MTRLPAHELGSDNIFADLGLPDAADLKLKSEIVRELHGILRSRKLTQTKAASIMGIAQPDLSKLLRGHLRGYSIERLMRMLTAMGRDVDIVVRLGKSAREPGQISFSPTISVPRLDVPSTEG